MAYLRNIFRPIFKRERFLTIALAAVDNDVAIDTVGVFVVIVVAAVSAFIRIEDVAVVIDLLDDAFIVVVLGEVVVNGRNFSSWTF